MTDTHFHIVKLDVRRPEGYRTVGEFGRDVRMAEVIDVAREHADELGEDILIFAGLLGDAWIGTVGTDGSFEPANVSIRFGLLSAEDYSDMKDAVRA